MSITLDDILDVTALEREIKNGYVRAQEHPEFPLLILNYTEKCVFDRHWNDVTLQTRGLIVAKDGGPVAARPWPKFFNYGEYAQEGMPELNHGADVRVYDKLDGSLGIQYHWNGEWRIATRGSFTSEQATEGTAMLREVLDRTNWTPREDLTYLYEIIYPKNRIVVNYGDRRELVLLDVIDTDSGSQADTYDWGFPGSWVSELPAYTLFEALALTPRENAEGIVVVFYDGTRVKVKQDDYLRLHRLVTGMSERRVWECLSAGQTVEEIAATLPDEFHEWVKTMGYELLLKFERTKLAAEETYAQIVFELTGASGTTWTRKDFALKAVRTPCSALLFRLLDGSEIDAEIWKQLRPVGHNPMRALTEETA